MGFGEGGVGHLDDHLHVAARGDFRHDAAVQPVLGHLRVDDVRENLPPVPHDGGGGFVTGGFDGKYVHAVTILSLSVQFRNQTS